jgi:hypothetical protein
MLARLAAIASSSDNEVSARAIGCVSATLTEHAPSISSSEHASFTLLPTVASVPLHTNITRCAW